MPKTKKEVVVETEDVESTANVEQKKSKKHKKDKKDKKHKKKSDTPVEAVAPVEAVKKTKKPKKEKAVVEAVEDTEVVEDSEVVEDTEVVEDSEVVEDADVEGDSRFHENREKTDELLKGLISTVQDRIASDKALLSSLRELNRRVTRERKEVGKLVKKLNKGQRKKRRGGNKSPGGFTKPASLSDEMCAFLEVAVGTELPRTEVTRRVNRYVKENDLQNPENKKQILADGKLMSLLYLKDSDELTYFNLQRFMKIHFLKKNPDTGEVIPFGGPILAE
jgi:chromatin remodeling complex protein RSC6